MDQAWKETIEKLTKETKKVLLDKKEKTNTKKTTNQEEKQIAAFTRKFEERILDQDKDFSTSQLVLLNKD